MKIVDAKTFVVGNPWKNWLFVKLYTDEGIVGLGEATGGMSTRPMEAAIHEMKPHYLGEDPRNVVAVWDRLYKGMYLRTNAAMAAIECACWDILGRSLGVPVWQLLGGKLRPRIRAYVNGWYRGPREPQAYADRAREVVAMGYTALKFDPLGAAWQSLDAAEEARAIRLTAAVREAVGDGVDLMVDAHDRLTVTGAVRMCRALGEYRLTWMEAPVLSTDVNATIEVARQSPIPIAIGGQLTHLRDVAALLEHQVVDIVQPELLSLGGLGGLKKVAAVAEAYGAVVAPHSAASPLHTLMNVHVGATLPNLLVQECFDDFQVPWSREVLRGTARIENGYIEVPNTPGFGVELDEVEAAKYPYGDRNFMRLFEKGWEDRLGAEKPS